jgi:diguanylate cyclase (GGDEF)-like protein
VYREKRRVLGEPVMMAVVICASLFWLATSFDHSAAISTLALAGQIVFLFFGTIVLRLSLPYAVAINIVLTLGAFGFTRWDKWMTTAEGSTSLCLIAACSLLALLTNYRLEAGQRTAYLLLLREDFRGKDLALLNDALATRSNHDGLTGLANRRYLNEYIQQVCDLATPDRRPVSIVMADIDHFKELNDEFGHVLGDIVLVALAEILRSSVRGSEDLVARFGGEEFVIVFPGMERTQACETAERLCVNVRNTVFNLPGPASLLRLSISCGVGSMYPFTLIQPLELITQADEALYRAKRAGRDQVCCGEPLTIDIPAKT